MKWVDPNYTDANHFDKEKHKQFKSQFFAINITQKRKTPFACFMNKKFDGFTSTDDFRKIVKDNILAKNDKFDLLGFIPSDDKIEIWKARFILIVVWLSNVLHDEKELFLNVIKALTINCGFLNFEKEADIKKWVDGGLKMSEEYVNFDKLRDFEKMKEKTKKKEEILKNALKVPKSSAPKLLQQALKKDETPKDCQFPNFKRGFLNNTSTEDEPKIEPVKVTTKVVRKTASDVVDKLITYIINQSGFEEYTPLEDLDEGIRKHMVDYLDEIEADIYWRMMNNETFSKLLMHKLEKYFDLKIEKGQKLVRKKRDAPVKKPENAPKIVETKETIDAIEENKKLKLKIDEMTTKLEESQRREQVLEGIQIKLRAELEEVGININEREEAAKELEKNSKLLLNKIKQDYREEIRKYKEEAQTRENRIQQLQDEQKENREFLRKEREKLYAEAEKNSRLANESVRKMKTELENAKFHENNHLSKISELLKENSQLKTHIEILEEKLDSDKNSEEISQDIQKLDVSSSDC
ncbi:unnamed protein product [Caenorhabditis angaria]|uniref:Uncharacterized protein n=1 Tax=Caenorhabditis angaria TaxID=860376 RepID=A0A9P1MSI4_9PELO|nr:unnamed protein product [Caenorhabditis angaria]